MSYLFYVTISCKTITMRFTVGVEMKNEKGLGNIVGQNTNITFNSK